jgi:hypothetical protein
VKAKAFHLSPNLHPSSPTNARPSS